MSRANFITEEVSIFKNLDRESQAHIADIMEERTYPKGSLLFSPQTDGKLFFLAKGKVKLYQISSRGREQLLRVVQEGEAIGAESLFSDEAPDCYAQAVTDIQVCTTSRQVFTDLLMRYPSVAINLLEEYSKKLRDSRRMAFRTASEEVIDRLKMYLEDLSDAQGSPNITLPLAMKELAELLATSPETLSRRFARLEEEGYLTRRGRIVMLEKK